MTPDEYEQTVRRYDNATTCGLVWTANFVAYRCRTCGISPCMSLCADCFQRGNHEGHDFNMFRSQAGGACDCGDTSVMKESGFCHRHGPKAHLDKPSAPPDLLCVAEAMMPRVILRLVHHLRAYSKPALVDRYLTTLQEADKFLSLLHKLSEMGAAMRQVMTKALTNPRIYSRLAVECDHADPRRAADLKRSYSFYEEAKQELTNCESPSEYQHIKSFQPELVHTTFLEELVFWTVKYEFPQKLVCFLLNMLPDLDYKEAFTQTFVHHYSRISVMLAHSYDLDTLSNRIVHVSVQLFSNEDLAFQMTQNFQLLHVMVISLRAMMTFILLQNNLQDAEKNFHYVVNCGHRIMKDHRYWPLVSDLNNVLTHRPVALKFLADASLLDMWFSFLSLFQGMNVNQRELTQHVEFEPNTYYAAFSAELEASATPMWALISHLKDKETLHLTKLVLDRCQAALQDWFDAIGFSAFDMPNPYQVSFHLPLHRYLSVFLCQAVCHQGASLKDLLPFKESLQMIMLHPLQAQVTFHEILSGLWVRNGLQIKGQAMTYIQCHFCNSMVDPDLLLLQICATNLDPDWFLKTVLERFHVWEWLTFHPAHKNTFLEPDKVMPMLEGALTFLATLMTVHTNIGMSAADVTRQEMVTLLCMSDRTHSQLMDMLPEKCGTASQNKDFEAILAQVADYKAPNFEAGGNMLQGMYIPKPEVWEQEYDPIHVMLRAVHRRDYQASIDRYAQHVRQAGKFKGSGTPWPPFRIPSGIWKEFQDPRVLLQCKTMHALIFIILYRAYQDPDISDQVISLCVFFLDMVLQFPPTRHAGHVSNMAVSVNEPSFSVMEEVADMKFLDWFHGDWFLQNIQQHIGRVVVTDHSSMLEGMVEEMEVVEEEEEDKETDMVTEEETLAYQVHSPTIEEETAGTSNAAVVTSTSTSQPFTNSVTSLVVTGSVTHTSLPALSSTISPPIPPSLPPPPVLTAVGLEEYMAVVPTPVGPATIWPQRFKLKRVPGRHNILLTNCNMHQLPNSIPLKALPTANKLAMDINESILSLLLKLHSKLSGKPDSYHLLSERHSPDDMRDPEDSRIGDGPFFIGQILDRITQLNVSNGEVPIQDIRKSIWPKKDPEIKDKVEDPVCGSVSREERRRRAKERQQKLMAEFASKQKAFLQTTMETDFDLLQGSDSEENQDKLLSVTKEYECVICGQTMPSTQDQPIGMVVLLQATSVVGHSHLDKACLRLLPCSDDEKLQLNRDGSLAACYDRRIEELARQFDHASWQMSINIGWQGGVHVQSCGHYLHVDCHKSYMRSLKNQQTLQSQRPQSLAVEKGEYSCPLCRQLANSVLPINPDMGEMVTIARCPPSNLPAVAHELLHITATIPIPVSSILRAMGGIMEDLTNSTYSQYRSMWSSTPSSYCLFLFVCSIARTNLEVELLQRGGNLFTSTALPSSPTKKACFVPLFHMLALHAKVLTQTPYCQLWSQLTGLPLEDHLSSLTPVEKEVPLFLKDVSALLIQIILTLPLNVDKVFYTCVVRVLYNLAYIQAVAQLSCYISQDQRTLWKKCAVESNGQLNSVGATLGSVIDHLEHSCLYLDNEDMDASTRLKEWTQSELEDHIKRSCLPFLRVAGLLQHHLFGEELLPLQLENTDKEFAAICLFLGIGSVATDMSSVSSTSCLSWATDNPLSLIRTWCQDYINFVSKSVIAARNLLDRPLKWHLPALLQLPHNYDQIFQYYHRRQCTVCHNIPKDPSICLVCGTMICLRENCCRQRTGYEAVSHSITCGAGTAMFLAVNSSIVIVIRGKRACLWGCVYLDSFGEEDRDLKRGKPLYLSLDRYSLLQQQWLSHSFDHTNKRWVWHKDNL